MTAIAETDVVDHGSDDHDHPTDATYWKVGAFLFAMTALEVSTYWWTEDMVHPTHLNLGISSAATAAVLLTLMTIKFVTVAMYFMHLKYDSRILSRVFLTGIVMAMAVYGATLTAMIYWHDSGVTAYVNAPRAKPKPPPPTEPPAVIPPAAHKG